MADGEHSPAPQPAHLSAAAVLTAYRPLTGEGPEARRLEAALKTLAGHEHDTNPTAPTEPGEQQLSISPAMLAARFKRIDAYFTLPAAKPFLRPEAEVRAAADLLFGASVLDVEVHAAVLRTASDFTTRTVRLAETIHLLHGPDPAPPLSALPGMWQKEPTLGGRLALFEAEAARLSRPSGRAAARFPGDPNALPDAVMPAYIECVRTVNQLLHHRPFLVPNLEREARGTLLDRFERLFKAARFETRPVEEPALRFRPHILPFGCDPLTAAEYYRTEQEIKEAALRLAAYDCLEPRHAIHLSAEAERFTEGLALYAVECSKMFWEGDHARLFDEFVRTVNRYPRHCQRMLFLRVCWRVLHPAGLAGTGVSELLRSLADAQRAHQSLSALRALAGS